MDTRKKIITSEEAARIAAGQPVEWFRGHFDPLLAEHARMLSRLAAPGRLLIVEVTNPARPLLSQQARAELVAGLAVVDHVILGHDISTSAPDSPLTQYLMEHVRSRSRSAIPLPSRARMQALPTPSLPTRTRPLPSRAREQAVPTRTLPSRAREQALPRASQQTHRGARQ